VIADGSSLRVALLADPASSQDVEVVDFKNPVEQPPAPTPNDLPVAAAGLPPAAPPQPPAAAQTVAPAPDAQTPPAGKPELKPAAKPVPRQANPPPAGENPTDDQ
jgi:hypothetical protein